MRRWRALTLAVYAALGVAPAALASSGSYATAGTGTYAASLWWLDFTGFSSATAAGGQAFSFSLPNAAGTLSTTVTFSGNGTMTAVAEPPWSGGGAFGHGAYNGLTGAPILYWLNQPGSAGTVSLTGLTMKDAGGNARRFALYAADGENTNSGESIVYTTTSTWSVVDTVNYYPGFGGGVPTVAGAGTATVTETNPPSSDGNYNASIVVGTPNPGTVSFALSNNEAVAVAVAVASVKFTVSIAGRVVAADQFAATLGYTSPAYTLKAVSTSGTATSAATGAISVIGDNSLTLATSLVTGSPSALSYYTGSMSCTNSGPGAATFSGTNTVLPSGAGTSFTVTPQSGDAIACTLTLTPFSQALTGTVYLDANHDAALDNGETGTSLTGLYVKLAPASGGACQTPATAAAAVAAGSGAYSLAGVIPGSYCLILTSSSALTTTTAYLPPGTIGTEAGTGVRLVTVTASPALAQNFGLYAGSTLALTVFGDTGAGSGTANDGAQNGAEAGIGGVAVAATAGGAPLGTATTAGDGTATLWLPASAVGMAVTVTPTAPGGDLATGGGAGSTGGTYARPSATFTLAAGAAYGGMAFGLVPPNSFAPTGLQSVQAGGTVFYPHTFGAGSAGAVSFTVTASASPALAGWSEQLFLDGACSGVFAAGDAAVTAPIAVKAGQTVCLLVKEFAPATAPLGAQNKVTVSATLVYSGSAAPASGTMPLADTTTVVAGGGTQLVKQVQNLSLGGAYGTTNSALPGQALRYQLTLANNGGTGLATVVMNDTTPAFTNFVTAQCPAALPAGLTGCSVAAAPAAGGQGPLQWTFAGSLASGAQVAVTYQVTVAQ